MKKIILFTFVIITTQTLLGQQDISLKNVMPPSPEASAFAKYGTYPCGTYTGRPDITIPIYEIKDGNLSVPISLSYDATGIRVNDMASWVGMNWSLNAGGMVSQMVVGQPDIIDTSIKFAAIPPRGSEIVDNTTYMNYLQALVDADGTGYPSKPDADPDKFFYSFNGRSGSFVLDRTRKIVQIPKTSLKISIIGSMQGFIITDEGGTTYIFNYLEKTESYAYSAAGPSPAVSTSGSVYKNQTTGYYLTQIVSSDGIQHIDFTYENEISGAKDDSYSETFGPKFANSITPQMPISNYHEYRWSGTNRVITIPRLKTISFSNGKVDFARVLGRQDDAGVSSRLDEITVYNKNIFDGYKKLKSFKFVQGYYYSPDVYAQYSALPNQTSDRYRLRLDTLKLKDSASTEISRYKFSYNSGTLPPKTSCSQDWWGYNGNQLGKVVDNAGPNLPVGFQDKTNGTNPDYAYDPNGNMISDYNKSIASITYNFLNLPGVVSITSKGTITYTYDAAGNKLQKTTVDQTVTPNRTINYYYAGDYVYRSAATGAPDTLEFISHPEGRLRPVRIDTTQPISIANLKYIYDYYLRDHLGSVRSVLTTEQQTDIYAATMETANATKENALFSNVSSTAKPVPPGFTNDASNKMVSKLNGAVNISGNKRVGPSIVLKVMTGDTISISTYGWYTGAVQPAATNVSALSAELLPLLTSGITGLNGSKGGVIPAAYTDPFMSSDITSMLKTDSNTYVSTKPKAFLNWMVVGEDYTPASSANHVNAVQMPVCNAGDTLKQMLGPTNMVVKRNGWIYVYLSNESAQDVYFDNLVINLRHGPLIEQKDYYPFGMENPALSTRALKQNYYENRIKYDGKELQSKEFSDGTGLEDYDYGARMYDPQIGRWNCTDPLADKSLSYSPYNYTLNNPINLIDPDGRIVIDPDASKEDKIALKRILKETRSHIGSLGKNSKELKALLGLSGFGSKKELMNFLKVNNSGPTLTVGTLTKGTAGGLDDGNGGSAKLGQTDANNINAGTITLDRGLVDVAKDAIESERTGTPTGALTPATGYALPNGVAGAASDAFSFIGRVMEHETTHWGAYYNLGLIGASDDVNILIFGANMSFERGRVFEMVAFGNLGNPFNPASNPSWGIVNQYTHTEYLYTNGQRNPSVLDPGLEINRQLQVRAIQFKLTKEK